MNGLTPIIDTPTGAVNHVPGFTMVPNSALAKLRAMPPQAERLYVRMCSLYRGKAAECTASTSLLMEVTGYRLRWVLQSKAELIRAGLVEVVAGGRGHSTTRYRLPDRATMLPAKVHDPAPLGAGNVHDHAPCIRLTGKTVGLPPASGEIPSDSESITDREWRRAMIGGTTPG